MGTIYVEVDIDTDDVLSEVSDADLIDEMKDRNLYLQSEKEDLIDIIINSSPYAVNSFRDREKAQKLVDKIYDSQFWFD